MVVAEYHVLYMCWCSLESPPLQVLEDNRNQLEASGVQLVANKEQLQIMGLQLEGRGQEVAALKQRVAGLERMVAGSLKGLLLQGEEAETKVTPLYPW